jgi:cell division protein FtsZ
MASNNKRASMREGPLAALFRKTEEEEGVGEGEDAGEAGVEVAAPAPESASEAKPRASRREARSSADSSSAEKEAPVEQRRELPHPALSASEPEFDDEPAAVPSPQERLRNVFSSEIPENIMERPRETAAPAAARSKPRREVPVDADLPPRDEPEPRPFGQAGPVIHPVIRVVGVGGAGVNAVNRMVEAEVAGVEFMAINTDQQSLQQSTADITLHIGAELTRGLGAGADAAVGRQAAMDDYDRVKALLKGSDMIFITAGAGGGTGTGAAPVVARIAREIGALTVAIVTKPFGFEGTRRAEQAKQGVSALADEVDTLIVVPNERLLSVLDKQTSMVDAFRVADDVLRQGVQGISDLVTLPGLINLDFADVRTIMSEAGDALLGIGMGVGEHRATEAAMQAVLSPLLETSMEGARSILLSITGGINLSLWEVNEAAKAVSEAAHPDANIIFGAMVDEKLDDQVWVTVVATGYRGEGRTGSRRGRLEEPAGEPRVHRSGAHPPAPRRDRRRSLADLEVPEFIPNP